MTGAADTKRPVMAKPDQVFSRAGGTDRLADVFVPRGAGPFPAIIFLHGGGWRFGDRRLAPDLRRFYAERGYVMVSIDYRLSGEAIFPASVIDTKCAVRWLRRHAAEYNVDPDRILLWGSSAGAHLASLAALSGRDEFASGEWADTPAEVAAVIDGYGPTDFIQADAHRDPASLPGDDPESAKLPLPSLSAAADSLESLYLGAAIGSIPDTVRAANPAAYARADACPFLILHGDCDAHVPLHQSRILFDALAAAGSPVRMIEVAGLGHGFLNRNDLDERGPHGFRIRDGARPNEVATTEGLVFETILAFIEEVVKPH